MEKLLMGIDIGTSACKVAVFSVGGGVMVSCTEEYPVYYPAPGFAEQNPEEWYRTIVKAVKGVLCRVNPKQIAAIGIDGQGWSCIPVDRDGQVLYNTPIWFDTRATAECGEIKEKVGEDAVFALTGNSIQPSYTTPKALWFKNHYPEIYSKTYKFLQSNSYIAYRLTGVMASDKSMGYGHYFYDMEKGCYDAKMLSLLGLEESHYPEPLDCHTVIGGVTQKAAGQTGLAVGTPVVIGGLDAACGTLGAGVVHAGQTQEQGGQAGGMSICIDRMQADKRLILGNHVVPGLWLLQGGTVAGGGAVKWFCEQFGDSFSPENPLKEMDKQAAQIAASSEGVIFLPYLNGERSPLWDPNAKGVYYGLSFSKTKAHLARATMEGVAFSLRDNLETAFSCGAKADRLYAMGGAANSALWTQIKADVTGLPISVPGSDEATCLGAVILAGVGVSLYSSFEQAVQKLVSIKREYLPNKENSGIYTQSFQKYKQIYKSLKGVMAE